MPLDSRNLLAFAPTDGAEIAPVPARWREKSENDDILRQGRKGPNKQNGRGGGGERASEVFLCYQATTVHPSVASRTNFDRLSAERREGSGEWGMVEAVAELMVWCIMAV